MSKEKDYSEQNFQEKFVKEMCKYRWSAPDELNGNLHKVKLRHLEKHWRDELNRLNVNILEGVPLTDGEFMQVLNKVKNLDNSYEAAKLLSMEQAKGKIDGIVRDKNPKVTRERLTLTIFEKSQVGGGNSKYEIAREVETDDGRFRFDILLLINGLPVINIELKRRDLTTEPGFKQFKSYYKYGAYHKSLLAFSQMMVVSTEMATEYFATPKSLNAFNRKFVFNWSDKNNKKIDKWEDVVKYFLRIPMAHQMVSNYLIIDEARDENRRKHMLMRPYQVHALQAIEAAAMGKDNSDGIAHGGFVWHTTGSGKTITSFKTALCLATGPRTWHKVIFLVDRRDLDAKTSEQFKAYSKYEPVNVDDTRSTYQLKKLLHEKVGGIVVTTTFKLHNLVKEMLENDDASLADKKYVFIIDEAHRTTMGRMMGDIKSYFKKNSLFFGFTGTPLFDESNVKGMINRKSEVIDTTEKLFGPELHRYSIDEAIRDDNVLGFNVNYINTGEFESYESLRKQLRELLKKRNPSTAKLKIEQQVAAMSNLEIEKNAYKLKLYDYNDEQHIPKVVDWILDHHFELSQDRKFNAILTAAYKERVLAFYRCFKEKIKENNLDLNIAMTVSFGGVHDVDQSFNQEVISEMFDDYRKFTGIHFSAGDLRNGEEAYFDDLLLRSTRGGSGIKDSNIDILIVADQLLTGYDSQYLNTLYVDRNLELHGLIQAYSRTNRILDASKEFGNIVNFKHPLQTKAAVEEALRLYGSGGSSVKVIVPLYQEALKQFPKYIDALRTVMPDARDRSAFEQDSDLRSLFFKVYGEAVEHLNHLMQYYQFKWQDIEYIIDESEWLFYRGAYNNLKMLEPENERPDEYDPINDGRPGLVAFEIINAEFILNLIGQKAESGHGNAHLTEETIAEIMAKIKELEDMGEKVKAELLRNFLHEVVKPGKLQRDKSVQESYAEWKKFKAEEALSEYAEKFGLRKDLLYKAYEVNDLKEPNNPYLNDLADTADYNKAKAVFVKPIEYHMNILNKTKPFLDDVSRTYE